MGPHILLTMGCLIEPNTLGYKPLHYKTTSPYSPSSYTLLQKALPFATAMAFSENQDWLSVLRYTTLLSFPVALHAAVKLNVFEILSKHGGPDSKLSAHEIAHFIPSVTNPRAPDLLDRVLHLLSSQTPFPHPLLSSSITIDPSTTKQIRHYALLPPSKYFLRDENGVSLGEWRAKQVMDRLDCFKYLDAVIVGGGNGFDRAYGHKISHHVAEHAGELAAVMSSFTALFMEQFLEVYDGFQGMESLVDVGGSTGSTLKHILDKYPHLMGINFDQPHIVSAAPAHPRLRHVGGNMLESIPSADAALLKLVLHDWEDDECVKILQNCKQAVTPEHGKVIVAELHVGDTAGDPIIGHQLDILMMSSHGSKTRTVEDYTKLGIAAGFTNVKVACLVNDYIVLEFLK